ncbi:D-hexose-6-phosphate mutarotase [Affinibrenneria salicis]|uniref:Putative glucose-6-phosphate 1-epimerase n=1 Tax=Affinibrenneria salicis TaxID=2590031 RepID=A0A5J5G430_9GAMM|nr:D-hexose-6-phosphate mutarotase [Affinibrenneria salicis]KAA9001799.1 D-hexose-6-phosphate mutarotase [Affinibrenneria salicis]
MSDTLTSLPVIRQFTPTITLRQAGQLAIVVAQHPLVNAAVALQGAQLLNWQPAGEQPVLWLSAQTHFTPGVAIRGGVPICFPWFGPAGSPSHGFARILPWEFTSHREDRDGIQLTFSLRDNEQTRRLWPHAFTLIARFCLGRTCHIELEAHGDYRMTCALHSYFAIGDIDQVAISGLGENYLDKVNGGRALTQQGDLAFSGRVDRIYTRPQPTSRIHDTRLQRTIEIQHQHHSDVVAWNPGAELARSMDDIADDGYKTFACVETASISNELTATPHDPARLGALLKILKR